MMKKTIKIFLLTCLLLIINIIFITNNNKIKGLDNPSFQVTKELKKEYIIKDSYFDLNLEGYTIKNHNVDLTKEGIYEVYYKDNITNIAYKKEIEVISLDYLTSNGIVTTNINEKEKLTYNYIDKVKISENSYAYLIELDKYDYRVYIVNGNSKTLSKKIYNEVPCVFQSIGYFKEYQAIYVCGWGYKTGGTGRDLIYIKLNLQAEVKGYNYVFGPARDESQQVIFDGEMFWYGGFTLSFAGPFEHKVTNEDAYVLGLDPINNISYYINLQKDGSEVLSHLSVNDNFVLACYSELNNDKYNNYLTIVDYESNFYDYILPFEENLIIVSSYCFDDYVYLFGYIEAEHYESYLIRVNLYDSSDITILNGFVDNSFSATKMFFQNNQLLLFYKLNNKENIENNEEYILNYQIYNILNNQLLLTNNINVPKEIINIYQDEDNNIYYLSNNCEYYLDINYLYYDNGQFRYNNEVLIPSKIFDEENISDFGNYEILYNNTFLDYDFYYHLNNIVDIDCNIENNNSYQSGIILNFNSHDAYLDGLKITSGQEVTSLGGHQLLLKGYQTEDVIINFKVVDVFDKSTLKKEQDNNIVNLTNKLNYTTTSNDPSVKEITIIDGTFEDNLLVRDETETLWYLLIPLFSALSTFAVTGLISKGRH